MEVDAKFVHLPDGRRVAYREQGLPKQDATRSMLVLHGFGSSRMASIPGVSEDLLKEIGVRLIAIDRPGYGLSSPNPSQTFKTAAADLVSIADLLELGDKIWLLGYSCGGAYCWGAARYIPERIAGIAMWAPVGNYWWKEFTDSERKAALREITDRTRLMFQVGRLAPHWVLSVYMRHVVAKKAGADWVEDCKKQCSPPDFIHPVYEKGGLAHWDSIESMKQEGSGMAQDLKLITTDWGFEPSDVAQAYRGPLHIWQGVQDWMVSPTLQRLVKRQIPELVHLHELPDGHMTFCYNDQVHRDTLSCLFDPTSETQEVSLDDVNTALKNSVSHA